MSKQGKAEHRSRAEHEQEVTPSEDGSLRDSEGRRSLIRALRAHVRMYRPHEAREDTVLFPAFRTVVSSHEFAALGEDFAPEERRRFGAGGFEAIAERVASFERALDIHDLQRFTPDLGGPRLHDGYGG
jgi:hypothetical protein